jgi:hypothetical protein
MPVTAAATMSPHTDVGCCLVVAMLRGHRQCAVGFAGGPSQLQPLAGQV